jgi:alpha-D-xyloside xylohydrolase
MGRTIAENNRLVWKEGREILWIEPYGEDTLRVRATRGQEVLDLPWALVEARPAKARVEAGERGGSITNGLVRAEVDAGGRIRFSRADTGKPLLEEVPGAWAPNFSRFPARRFRPDGALWSIEAFFSPAEERIYGLGQHPHGFLDQKGCVIPLEQTNAEVAIPFLLSSRGYGFLWNNPSLGRVEASRNGTRWVARGARQMDYLVMAGRTHADILHRYADATGHPPLLPEWASGFWQCKLRYASQEELLSVAREHKRRGLPMSVIVIDYFHWTVMGDWKFDPSAWPDPSGMVRELERMGIKVMVSIWPTVNPLSENYAEMRDRGLLLGTERGVAATWTVTDNRPDAPVPVFNYDPSHPEARAFLWDRVRRNYVDHGIRTFWLDACEPELKPPDHDNLCYAIGSGREVGCIYPLLHARAFWDGLRSIGESGILTLCRSAWAGSQRYGAAVWSGDIDSTFESLARQVRAGLNIGLSGIPWWTTDIGGFFGGDPSSPYFRELIVRWFQYGAFCPLFRLHGHRAPTAGKNGGPNEVWSFGDEAYGILKEILLLRERMRPYVMKQMRVAHERGTPPMRPLFFDFPDDAAAGTIEDEFLFGPDVLVAPITTQGAVSRDVYLPAGVRWREARTGRVMDGGQWLKADAPLSVIPVYVRDGADVPIA